jgi:hypothetical protein
LQLLGERPHGHDYGWAVKFGLASKHADLPKLYLNKQLAICKLGPARIATQREQICRGARESADANSHYLNQMPNHQQGQSITRGEAWGVAI